MACSDNVVRAGLTPKFKDVRTLCDMLDYRPRTCEDTKLASFTKPTDTFVQTYNPHVNEFVVDKLSVGLISPFNYLCDAISTPCLGTLGSFPDPNVSTTSLFRELAYHLSIILYLS